MPLPRSFGTIARLPNDGSEHQTPASLMLDQHWCQMQLVERWSWVRFARLCQFLKFTPWELASLVMLRHEKIEDYQRTGRLNGSNMRPVALVLTMLEATVLKSWTDDIITDPFPQLPNSAPQEEPNLGIPETSRESSQG